KVALALSPIIEPGFDGGGGPRRLADVEYTPFVFPKNTVDRLLASVLKCAYAVHAVPHVDASILEILNMEWILPVLQSVKWPLPLTHKVAPPHEFSRNSLQAVAVCQEAWSLPLGTVHE